MSSAISEPRFDKAYKRHGDLRGSVRVNQRCSNGPVADSTKYGPPTVAASSNKIRSDGSTSEAVFHAAAFGRIGRKNSDAASKPKCTAVSRRALERDASQCA